MDCCYTFPLIALAVLIVGALLVWFYSGNSQMYPYTIGANRNNTGRGATQYSGVVPAGIDRNVVAIY